MIEEHIQLLTFQAFFWIVVCMPVLCVDFIPKILRVALYLVAIYVFMFCSLCFLPI